MSEEKTASAPETGRMPSMFASLLVFGVMIGLILLCVYLFGEDVVGGPLEVSMTLAALFALGVALFYGYRSALITKAISHGVHSTLGVVFILFAIGAVIGSLYLCGTVAAVVYYRVEFLNPHGYYIVVFLLASLLSVVIGSSFTTVVAVGVPMVGLASVMGVSPAVVAWAAISGAFLGDKVSRISDTFVLTTSVVGGVTVDEHRRMVMRTAIPTWIISAIAFVVLGFVGPKSEAAADIALVQNTISQYFDVSLLAFLPLVVIVILSALRVSGFVTLMLTALTAVFIAAFTQLELINRIADDPGLGCFVSAVKVGISTLATGFSLDSGVGELDQVFAGGGTMAMPETVWLVLVAAAFGAIVDYTGMMRRVLAPVIRLLKGARSLIVATCLSCIGMNAFAADPYVSIVLTGRMYREEYIRRRL